jgi:phosphoribosylglycinamide formyltransferase-1
MQHKMKIAVLVSGGGTNLQAILDGIDKKTLHGVKVSLVVSSSPHAFAIIRAQNHNIPVFVISRKQYTSEIEYDDAMLSALRESGVDLIVLAGFLSLLGEKVVSYYHNRIINVHPALIPSFCGPGMYGIRPHEAALARGVKISGATVHFVNGKYDEGPILLQKSVCVLDDDTPEILQKRIMVECEQVILPMAIQLIADNKIIFRDNKVSVLTDQEPVGKDQI